MLVGARSSGHWRLLLVALLSVAGTLLAFDVVPRARAAATAQPGLAIGGGCLCVALLRVCLWWWWCVGAWRPCGVGIFHFVALCRCAAPGVSSGAGIGARDDATYDPPAPAVWPACARSLRRHRVVLQLAAVITCRDRVVHDTVHEMCRWYVRALRRLRLRWRAHKSPAHLYLRLLSGARAPRAAPSERAIFGGARQGRDCRRTPTTRALGAMAGCASQLLPRLRPY